MRGLFGVPAEQAEELSRRVVEATQGRVCVRPLAGAEGGGDGDGVDGGVESEFEQGQDDSFDELGEADETDWDDETDAIDEAVENGTADEPGLKAVGASAVGSDELFSDAEGLSVDAETGKEELFLGAGELFVDAAAASAACYLWRGARGSGDTGGGTRAMGNTGGGARGSGDTGGSTGAVGGTGGDTRSSGDTGGVTVGSGDTGGGTSGSGDTGGGTAGSGGIDGLHALVGPLSPGARALALAWCRENGAGSVSLIVLAGAEDEFVASLLPAVRREEVVGLRERLGALQRELLGGDV